MTLRTHTPTHTHLLQAIRVDSRSSFILQQLLVPIVSQKLDDSLDLLRSRARRHKESIRCVDDDEIVHAKAGDETVCSRNNDTAGHLFQQD